MRYRDGAFKATSRAGLAGRKAARCSLQRKRTSRHIDMLRMNCGNFEKIIHDLVRERMMDAAVRESARTHAAKCDRCAMRLSDERALTFGLKALADLDEAKSAPAATESVLLGAFREQKSMPVMLPRARSLRHPVWGWAVAAAILIFLGLIAYRAVQREPRKPDNQDFGITTATPSPSSQDEPKLQPKGPEMQPATDQKVVQRNPARESRRHHRKIAPSVTDRFIIIDEITAYSREVEDATDFLPIGYNDDQTPMESGQLIRVQMPRPALVRFGLPVNVEGVDVPVKADLLVGEDGIARAIRFVR